MAITSTLRAGLSFAALVALTAAGVGATLPGEPAVVPGCEPGTQFTVKADFTWPTGVSKPSTLGYGTFRCVIQDTATIDAYTVGTNASTALVSAVGSALTNPGPLASSSTPGLEGSYSLYFSSVYKQGKPVDRASANSTLNVKGTVANPVMKCFGLVSPSPDWFFATTIDLCSAPAGRFGTYDLKLYDLGTKNGNTFASSTASTTPKGTVQPVAAFPQVFGKVHVLRTPAKTKCRTAGEIFAWKFTALWPSSGGVKPANFKYTAAICAIHTTRFELWSTGTYASGPVEMIAERGSTEWMELRLQLQLRNPSNTELVLWRKFDDFSTESAQIKVPLPANMPNYPVFSCIAKMSPSPDWFIGVRSVPMCGEHDVITKFSPRYDAGTDDGTTWTAYNPRALHTTVQSKSGSGFFAFVTGGFTSSAAGVVAATIVTVMLALSAL